MKKARKSLSIQRGDGPPTWGAVWIDLGRLRLIWCAPDRPSTPGHPNIPGHPNRWLIVWRRATPEWDPRTKWQGSDEPGPYWKGCDARLQRKRGVDPEDARCGFPNCDCLRHLPERQREELKRRHAKHAAESKRYKSAWLKKMGKGDGDELRCLTDLSLIPSFPVRESAAGGAELRHDKT